MPYLKKPNKQPSRTFNREERQKIYQSTKWKELRLELCLAKDIVKPAEDIHHIDSFMNYTGTKRLAKAFDFNNLMSICKECHAKEHHYEH